MLTSSDLNNLAYAADQHAAECEGAERAYFEALATKARVLAHTQGYTPSRAIRSSNDPF